MTWSNKKLIFQVFFYFFILNGKIGADLSNQANESVPAFLKRRLYGLNFASKCDHLDESFKCMSVCKSIGYKVFRMDFTCRCFCHNIPSTTLLPFFKYVTNSTRAKWPTTRSARLFEIAADTQPPPTIPPTKPPTTTTQEVKTAAACKNDAAAAAAGEEGKAEGEAEAGEAEEAEAGEVEEEAPDSRRKSV